MAAIATEKVRWTIHDLDGFPDNGNRYEIIAGNLFVTRAPHWDHQDTAGAAYAKLRAWSQTSGLGTAAFAPGIVFSEADNVIPDVVWISNDRLAQLLDDAGHLTGAPELVIEVLSSSDKDKKRDRETKVKLYSIQGVLEHWIIDRQQRSAEVYRREQGTLKKVMTVFDSECLTSPLLPGLSCQLASLFG